MIQLLMKGFTEAMAREITFASFRTIMARHNEVCTDGRLLPPKFAIDPTSRTGVDAGTNVPI
jgi:hypothetical protein